MSTEEIIRMMESSCDADKVPAWKNDFWTITQDELERFAFLVAAAEREACAEICDRLARRYGECPDVEPWAQGFKEGASVSAAKIRARGQE